MITSKGKDLLLQLCGRDERIVALSSTVNKFEPIAFVRRSDSSWTLLNKHVYRSDIGIFRTLLEMSPYFLNRL